MKNIEFINAGAGSGKTWFLTDKLTKVLYEGTFQANEVILTTFTEKAAAELKNKAQEALLKAGLDQQAHLLSMAAIGTIHSVAFQLIRSYWQYLGLGVDLKVLVPDDKGLILNQSLALIPTEEEIHELEDIIRKLDMRHGQNFIDFNCWKKDILELIEKALNNRIGVENLQPSLDYSLGEIDRVFSANDTFAPDHWQINSLLESVKNVAEDDKPTKASEKRINTCSQLLGHRGDWGIGEYQNLISLLEGLPGKYLNQLHNVDGVLISLNGLLGSSLVRGCLNRYAELLFSITARGIQYYNQYKQQHKLIDYSDMEVHFLELLNHEAACEEIRNSYRCVFVDEFQDSSPMQVAIFIKLSDLVGKSYWVGDPKQAIYDFRGTDPQLIEAVLERLGSVNNDNLMIGEPLSRSWRSRPQIVALTNNVFSKALSDQVDASFIELSPIRTAEELPTDENNAPVQHWILAADKQEEYFKGIAMAISGYLAKPIEVVSKSASRFSLNQAENFIVARSIEPADIAVLCRRRDAAAAITAELRKGGLQVSSEQPGLMNTAEIRLMLAMMNYYLDTEDTLAKATIVLLATPGMTTAELIEQRLEYLYGEQAIAKPGPYAEVDDIEDYIKFISTWELRNRETGDGITLEAKNILKTIDLIRYESSNVSVKHLVEKIIVLTSLGDIVARWTNPLQRKDNLETLRSMAGQYEERCATMDLASSVRGFIDSVSGYGSDSIKQGEAAGKDAVNVLTYHRSKGLEWPVVVLTELNYNHFSDMNLIAKGFFGVNVYNPEAVDLENPFRGKLISLLPWPFGAIQRSLPDEVKNRILIEDRYQRHSDRSRKEAKRLLYVGMTRARDILILTSRSKDTLLTWIEDLYNYSAGIPYENAPTGDNILHTNDRIRTLPLDESMSFPETLRDNVRLYFKNGPVDQKDPMFINPSKALSVENITAQILVNFEQRIPRSGTAVVDDDTVGNCIHHLYYQYTPELSDEIFLNMAKAAIENFGLEGELTNPEKILESVRNLYRFLEATYGPAIKVHKELTMQQYRDERIYNGQADMVWETEHDLILVDYKSNSGAPTNVINDQHDKYSGRYSGQLACYQSMLDYHNPEGKKVKDTLIYYAVIGVVVKVAYSLTPGNYVI